MRLDDGPAKAFGQAGEDKGLGHRIGDRAGARAVAERYAGLYRRGDGPGTSGFFIELSHHLAPDDDWLVAETARLARELGLPEGDISTLESEER